MNYKIIKFIPIVLFALVFGIPYIIFEPIGSLVLLLSAVFAYLIIRWYDYFNKKDLESKDFRFMGRK